MRAGVVPALAVLASLAALSAAALGFCLSRGWVLYYGDAVAHLNIARRFADSLTPGWEQLGTVWLPLPHLLMLPLVRDNRLWQTGLAGAIPAALCFILAGWLFFLAARRAFSSNAAGAAACLLLALNPNLLYLQSTPMTEPVFLASSAGVLYFTILFRERQSLLSVLAAGLFTLAATLTRYEGWFLIPFVTLYFLLAARRRRLLAAALYGALASLGPLYWLAHNAYYYSNPLEFYNGPYSAMAYYQRALAAGMARYAGDHDWAKAWLYLRSAARLCARTPLVWMGAAGLLAAALRRVFWPLALLALAPAFYLISIHSGGTPIFVPTLWPQSYYNSRYALTALPLLAFAAAALVALAPQKLRAPAAVIVVLAAIAPWLGYPRADNWVVWKEAQVNSQARRAWTREAAAYLARFSGPGDRFLAPFGDLTGIFLEAGIPLRRVLHSGNGVQWAAATANPDVFLRAEWALTISGQFPPNEEELAVARVVGRMRRSGVRYECVKLIALKGAPVIGIYRRLP